MSLLALVLTACASAPYEHEPFDPVQLTAQAERQNAGAVTVSAAVPGRDRAEAIFGFPIYESGIQPVWIRIENDGERPLRYAPVSTDDEYFSPLEVAYMHRKGYSDRGLRDLERRMYALGMARYIPAGETVEGFVFTHVSPGTKSINVDLFAGGGGSESFTFFLNVPGFEPDHSRVDFAAFYGEDDIRDFDAESFQAFVRSLPCCTEDQDGNPNGLPVSLALIGPGENILRALLRAGWYETPWSREREKLPPEQVHYLFGRPPDAIFRIQRSDGEDRNELHTWLSPWRLDGQPVWVGLATHFVGQRNRIKQALFGSTLDPDMDQGRNFFLQNLWYEQGLRQFAWIDQGTAVEAQQPRTSFLGSTFFTDGHKAVLWVSGEPYSLMETERLDWSAPPRKEFE